MRQEPPSALVNSIYGASLLPSPEHKERLLSKIVHGYLHKNTFSSFLYRKVPKEGIIARNCGLLAYMK